MGGQPSRLQDSAACSSGEAVKRDKVALFALVHFIPSSLGLLSKTLTFGVGYGLAVAFGGLFSLFGAPSNLPAPLTLQALGATAHGVRLASYLFSRQMRGDMPKRARPHERDRDREVSPGERLRRLPLIAGCAALYSCITSPVLFATSHPVSRAEAVQWAGVALQWSGVLLAAAADWQKSAYKLKHSAAHWVDQGLYTRVRHPNYLGELMVWTGAYLVGAPSFQGGGEWATATLGLLSVWATMLHSTRHLEAKQRDRYGSQEAYHRYVADTAALLPALHIPGLQMLP